MEQCPYLNLQVGSKEPGGRPGPGPPLHGTSWTVRIQLGHVLFPTWLGRWQLCLVHITSFNLLRVPSADKSPCPRVKVLAEPSSSPAQHISLSFSLSSLGVSALRDTVRCNNGCWKPFSVDASFHSPVQVAREIQKEAAKVQMESRLH